VNAESDLVVRRHHPIRWLALAAVVVLVVVATVAATRPSYQATQVGSPLLGRAAPPIVGTDFAGRRFSLSQYRGRYVYVNFFASWCPPCQTEEPQLVNFAFQQGRSASGASVVSVVFNDTVGAARQFITQWGQDWPVIADQSGSFANSYGVESPPMTFLVDPAGNVAGVWAGPVTDSQLDAMLATARRAGA
jgi:thiol-disulfide isomerase/thioredoxin